MLKPKVVIVVLNWNGRDDTLVCLRSVQQIDYPNFVTLIVDNGSSDDSVAAIRTSFPDIEVIESGANLGFSGGNNLGLKRALEVAADYVLLLNNDTVVDPGLLRAFVSAAERFPNAGAFSGRIYVHDDPDRIWYAGAQWDAEKSRFIALHEGAKDDGLGSGIPHETGYACGCAFFVPAARLRDIGLLCDDFFLYFEETDWCYRARAAGHPSMLVPDAKVWHKVSVSFGGENSPLALYFITRNRMLWAKRHATVSQRLRLHTESLRTLFRRFILPLLGGRVRGPLTPKVWWWSVREAFLEGSNIAYYFGVRDFWLRRFGDCPPAVRQLARQPPQFSGSVSTISQPE